MFKTKQNKTKQTVGDSGEFFQKHKTDSRSQRGLFSSKKKKRWCHLVSQLLPLPFLVFHKESYVRISEADSSSQNFFPFFFSPSLSVRCKNE